MSFTFQTDGEGFNVQIFLKTTLLKEPLVKSARSHGWACYVQYFCIWRDEMWVKFWNFKSFQFSSLHHYTWCDTWGFRSLVNKLRTWRSQAPLQFQWMLMEYSTLLGTITYPLPVWYFWLDVTSRLVGYVSFLEGMLKCLKLLVL